MPEPARLKDVKETRAALRTTMGLVEEAAAAPLSGRAEDWRKRLLLQLDELDSSWARHIAVTEGENGLFAEVTVDAPQLAPRLAKLHKEHDEIGARIAAVREGLATADADGERLGELREQTAEIIGLLVRHRQHGADLLYEAYVLDVGSSE